MNTNFGQYTLQKPCPKAGIRIHHRDNSPPPTTIRTTMKPQAQAQTQTQGAMVPHSYAASSTTCMVQVQPTTTSVVDFRHTRITDLSLDIGTYTLEGLLRLFNISSYTLTEEMMKEAKQIVHKMHPDKSRLDPKYFVFFKEAFARLLELYQFQRQQQQQQQQQQHQRLTTYSTNQEEDKDDAISNEQKQKMLREYFTSTEGSGGQFNLSKFNEMFDKYGGVERKSGYDEWFSSSTATAATTATTSEPMFSTTKRTTAAMHADFDKIRQQAKTQYHMVTYQGVQESYLPCSSIIQGSSLDTEYEREHGYSDPNGMFTDLKQAYEHAICPLGEDDYAVLKDRYKSVEQYSRMRENMPDMKQKEGIELEQWKQQQQEAENRKSAQIAYRLAVQMEQARDREKAMWGEIQRLKN